MTGDLAAAGDLATGGIIGRAIEPQAGERAHGAEPGALCLNCGTALAGEYCHACGQPGHLHKTIASIGHDVLHGVFHFDGKIWRTLPMLFTRPGELTRRYIAGERARFVSPLALFLFSVFLMVATFETVGGPFSQLAHATQNGKELTPAELDAELAKARAALPGLQAQRAQILARKGDTAALDKRIEDAQQLIDGLQAVKEVNAGKVPTVVKTGKNIQVHTGSAALDARVKAALASPELFLYRLQSSAYKFSWMLVPISVPFIWLLFAFRRDVGPYDHAIFAIYSLSAMTLGVVGLSLLRSIGFPEGPIVLTLMAGPPIHMYLQLRGAYRIGRWSAAWRTIALLASTLVVAVLFFLLVLSLAA